MGNLKKYAIRLTSTSVICTMSGNEEGFKVFGVLTSSPVSQSRVLPTKSRSWSRVFTDQEGRNCVLHNLHLLRYQSFSHEPTFVVGSGVLWMSSILRICMFNYHKRTRQLTNSNQPIACLSNQQAGHVTHRTPSVSKNRLQGLPQQLSNLQTRRAI